MHFHFTVCCFSKIFRFCQQFKTVYVHFCVKHTENKSGHGKRRCKSQILDARNMENLFHFCKVCLIHSFIFLFEHQKSKRKRTLCILMCPTAVKPIFSTSLWLSVLPMILHIFEWLICDSALWSSWHQWNWRKNGQSSFLYNSEKLFVKNCKMRKENGNEPIKCLIVTSNFSEPLRKREKKPMTCECCAFLYITNNIIKTSCHCSNGPLGDINYVCKMNGQTLASN